MAGINKILDKVNTATNAFKSLKGVQSKIEGFRNQALSSVDQLEQQAAEAERVLEKRRLTLQKGLSSTNVATRISKQSPETIVRELQYPLEDELDNFIIFSIRPRKVRGGNGANLLSKEKVEIALYVPDGIVSTASVGYKAQGVGTLAREFLEEGRGGDANQGFLDNLEGGVDAIVNIVKTGMQKLANTATGGVTDFIQGQAVNPMEEQMLDGVQFRAFTFNYEFYPRSEDEARMINEIIYTLRTAMLPDTFGAGQGTTVENYFNYPNVFDVFYEGPIASKLDGFLPMVCTKVDVDHFGGQKVAMFADGQPLKTTVTLEFLEIKILTQESYQQISPLGDTSIGTGQASLLNQRSAQYETSNRLFRESLSEDESVRSGVEGGGN